VEMVARTLFCLGKRYVKKLLVFLNVTVWRYWCRFPVAAPARQAPVSTQRTSVSQTQHTPAASSSQTAAAVVNSDDEDAEIQQRVLDCVVDDFLQVVPHVDRQTAQTYVINSQMNLDVAISAFFEDQTS